MYKIYINNAPLVIAGAQDKLPEDLLDCILVKGTYLGKTKFFFQFIDYLEKNGEGHAVWLLCLDPVKAFGELAMLYELIEAGGGVVRNRKGEIAMIFRRGFWDLPKGKIDPGEHILQTAVREVREEIGLKHVSAGEHLLNTYHTYRTGKGKRVLKKSTWFLMDTVDEVLSPQFDEDIEKAEWVVPQHALDKLQPIFSNIRIVIEAYLKIT
jgi:8-oxo-dGTP pyrophosphatase MutT (NUDIX family)